jgi:hypothetical protein
MALLLFWREVMQCVKNVTPQTEDRRPFECDSVAHPGPDLDDDGSEVADDHETGVPEEAGYGYGV